MSNEIKTLGKQNLDSARASALFLYQRYITPFIYGPMPPYNDKTIINNGTIIFAEGKETFGITCAHCINGLLERRAKEPNIFLRFGDFVIIDIESKIIDKDDELDLCTIKLNKEDLLRVGGERNFLKLFNSPVLNSGFTLCIIGFPGEIVKPISENKLEAGIFCIFEIIREGNLSDKSFVIELNKSEWEMDFNQSQIDLNKFNKFGGFSGCPVIFQDEVAPKLVGVVFEDYPSSEDIIIARARYSIIDEYGKIIRY